MRFVCKRGAVAAGVAAAVVLVAGCGGGGDEASPKAGGASASSAPASPVESSSAPVVDPGPVYPAGPEGDIDRAADENGWVYDSLYGSASEFVQDICDSLPDSAKDGASRPQWLAESGNMADDGQEILELGIPKLCPKWTKTLKAAVSGDYERWISSGDYVVVAKPAPYDPDADVQEIAPGSYEARGEFSDCYWERTSQSGDIIENKFVTQARVLSVTLRVGELFKNECGTFRPVG